MIVLLSRQDDGSTREVAEWLSAMGKSFIRLNSDDGGNRFLGCDLSTRAFKIMIRGREYLFSPEHIQSVWNRRRGFSEDTLVIRDEALAAIYHKESSVAKAHLEDEVSILFDFLNYIIQETEGIKQIGNASCNVVNKLVVLQTAKKMGLNIPRSYVVTTRRDLKILLKKEKRLITKALGNGVYRFTETYGYYSYTEKITAKWANKLPQTFFPSLVQTEIEKDYELRIFYLDGQFYSMAIFSSEFVETSIDFRKAFRVESAPRSVPYQLPGKIERKLSLLMEKMKLNTGSIDMIVTPDKQYFFLEVNPIGQFGMVSRPCNYYLEKKIAEIL